MEGRPFNQRGSASRGLQVNSMASGGCLPAAKIGQFAAHLTSDELTRLRSLRFLFRALAVVLGAAFTWAAAVTHSMNPDGVSYLDIGDALMAGDWQAGLNPVWGPLYPLFLGAANRIFKPPIQWQFPLVHVVNFLIFLLALVAFEFFWQRAGSVRHRLLPIDERRVAIPTWAWSSLGYSLFLWSSLTLVQIWAVTPDMLMAALLFVAAGFVWKIRAGDRSPSTFLLLGLSLGLGYLTKAIMFPVGILFWTAAFLSLPEERRPARSFLLGVGVFTLISGAYVLGMSTSKGRFTTGEVGKLTYARYVNGLQYPHWQGGEGSHGRPIHPTRRISSNPPVYEFGSPIRGTYPVSYDPSYWYEGLEVRWDLGRQFRQILKSGSFYSDLLFLRQGGILLGAVALLMLSGVHVGSFRALGRRWGLALVAGLTLGAYGLVYVEPRYVGAFLILAWGDVFANIRLPDDTLSRRLLAVLPVVMALHVLVILAGFTLSGFIDLSAPEENPSRILDQRAPPDWPGEAALFLRDLGVKPGDDVAVIGYGFDSYWARLADVRIVAELLASEADPFWRGTAAIRNQVIEAFAGTGAKAIIAENVPPRVSLTGWRQVGDSNYYILLLDQRHESNTNDREF